MGQGGQRGRSGAHLPDLPPVAPFTDETWAQGTRAACCRAQPGKDQAGPRKAAALETSSSRATTLPLPDTRPPPAQRRALSASAHAQEGGGEGPGSTRWRLRSPGVNPQSGVWAPPGSLFINTQRGHRQGGTLKVVGSEVRGQQGCQRGDQSLRLSWLLVACSGRQTALPGPGLPGAPRGAHVVRLGAAPPFPHGIRGWQRPLVAAPHAALPVAPAHNASRRAFRSAQEPGVGRLRPHDNCATARPGLARGGWAATRPRSHARRRGGPGTPRQSGAGPPASTWPWRRSALVRSPLLPAQPGFALLCGGPAGARGVPRARLMPAGPRAQVTGRVEK